MAETQSPLTLEIADDFDVSLLTEELSQTAIAKYGLEVYAFQAVKLKEKVDDLAAEIAQRQEKVKLLHEILQGINKLSNENGLDISQQPELVKKLKVAKELGLDIADDQMKFTSQERDFLKESLHMTADDYNNENKLQTQKMHVVIQEADRWLMLANALVKIDERMSKRVIDKMK